MRSACRLLEKSVRTKVQEARQLVPMEHYPLRHCDNAVLGLVQRREFRLECLVGERHVVLSKPKACARRLVPTRAACSAGWVLCSTSAPQRLTGSVQRSLFYGCAEAQTATVLSTGHALVTLADMMTREVSQELKVELRRCCKS